MQVYCRERPCRYITSGISPAESQATPGVIYLNPIRQLHVLRSMQGLTGAEGLAEVAPTIGGFCQLEDHFKCLPDIGAAMLRGSGLWRSVLRHHLQCTCHQLKSIA